MVSYEGSLQTSRPPADVFAYLSEFSHTQEWDPGTVESVRIDHGPLSEGSSYKVVAQFLGRQSELRYRVTELTPPNVVALVGKNETVTSNDRITVTPAGAGSRVSYRAELTFSGIARFAEPLLKLAFKRVGDQALEGLNKKLSSTEPLPGAA